MFKRFRCVDVGDFSAIKRHLQPKLQSAGRSSVGSGLVPALYSIESMCHFNAGFYRQLSVSSNASRCLWRQAILKSVSECLCLCYPVFLSWTDGGLTTASERVSSWRQKEYQLLSSHSLVINFG